MFDCILCSLVYSCKTYFSVDVLFISFFLYDQSDLYTIFPANNGINYRHYVKELRQKDPKFSSGYSSIKDRLRSSVSFLIKGEGSALSFYQKLVPKYFRRVFFIYN